MILLSLACDATPEDTDPVPTEVPDTTCEDYWAMKALPEVTWDGDSNTCDSGAADGLSAPLDTINYMRELAGLEAYTLNTARALTAQTAAALMHANDDLDHEPPDSWHCWTQEGADVAARSLLATTPATESIGLFMVDPGNNTSMVHRRWLLSDWIESVGIGSTDEYATIDLGLDYGVGTGWTAWPPPGKVPLRVMKFSESITVDREGWSIQSDVVDFTGANVVVTGPDGPLDVVVSDLLPNRGSGSALSFQPEGWRSRAGIYTVEVPREDIRYTVEFVACPEPDL